MTDTPNHEPHHKVLYAMATNLWANSSYGERDSPIGQFFRLTNTEPELQEITEAFSQEIETAHLEQTAQLLGHFIVTDKLDGYTVDEYDTRSLMMTAFNGLVAAHDAWEVGR